MTRSLNIFRNYPKTLAKGKHRKREVHDALITMKQNQVFFHSYISLIEDKKSTNLAANKTKKKNAKLFPHATKATHIPTT